MAHRIYPPPHRAPFLLLALLLCSCGGRPGPREITHTREVSTPTHPSVLRVSSAQRFGLTQQAHTHGDLPTAVRSPFTFTTPPGWEQLPASSMRLINLRVGGEEGAQCYLTRLVGDGGGFLANVNRWRQQMGLEIIDEAGLEALPTREVLGISARLVELEGSYGGMDPSTQQAGAKLLGVLLSHDGQLVTMKMVGPAELVTAERDAFLGLLDSLAPAGQPASGSRESEEDPDPHAAMADLPLDELPAGDSPFEWDLPEGWTLGAPRPMRVATFAPGGATATECYISILGGGAGGLEANINRWRQQMGQTPYSSEEIAGLPTLSVLGQEAPLVEIPGTYTGMSGETTEGYVMLGVTVPLGGSTVFVKMIGPQAEVLEAREAFEALCGSLR